MRGPKVSGGKSKPAPFTPTYATARSSQPVGLFSRVGTNTAATGPQGLLERAQTQRRSLLGGVGNA